MSKSNTFTKVYNFLKRKFYKTPNKRDIESLIRKLKPVRTENELIRLGGPVDGGYLVPNDLENIEACFSPGVGTRSTFEKECAEHGMKIFMADASVTRPSIENEKFNFIKKYIGKKTKGDFISLQDWIKQSNIEPSKDLILQMDIEGYEYEVFLNTPQEILERYRMIVVEFHMLTSIEYPYYFQRARKVFDKLLKEHTCVHIHPNNCCGSKIIYGIEVPGVAEFTFYRNDRFVQRNDIENLPHPLDRDNLDNADSLELAKAWYR